MKGADRRHLASLCRLRIAVPGERPSLRPGVGRAILAPRLCPCCRSSLTHLLFQPCHRLCHALECERYPRSAVSDVDRIRPSSFNLEHRSDPPFTSFERPDFFFTLPPTPRNARFTTHFPTSFSTAAFATSRCSLGHCCPCM